MTDHPGVTASSPSVPVESREQPRDWYGFAAMFVRDHQPEPGGCTCGFCAWSVEHVAVTLAIELQQERDATIRELRAEVEAKETLLRTMDHFAEVAERCDAKSNAYLAERDRARDLAAHLRKALVEAVQGVPLKQPGRQAGFPSQEWCYGYNAALDNAIFALRAALAAHLEAEQAERTE